MQVAKWGNSLTVRLPTAVVEALDLKPGDGIDLHVRGDRSFASGKASDAAERLARLREHHGPLPASFIFDRVEAHER